MYGQYLGLLPCILDRITNVYNLFWLLQPVLSFLITYLLRWIVNQCIEAVFQPVHPFKNNNAAPF